MRWISALMMVPVLVTGLALAYGSKKQSKSASQPTPVTGDPVRTVTGLEYWDIRVGDGALADRGNIVLVHYTGWLLNGKKFDSSIGQKPLRFHLGNGEVIKGWDQGIKGMRVGGKRQLRIPPVLAYGDHSSGEIPPGATLIFDVELMGVQ
jgi:FKBP-type peptidyl-prolyl cis-trans isomerase